MNLPIAFLSGQELIIVAIVILVLFGGTRIPALMRSLGRGAGEFQKGIDEGKKLMDQAKEEALRSEPDAKPKPE